MPDRLSNGPDAGWHVPDCLFLEQFFDQVDATTGSVEFVTRKLIRWTGSITKATVHAAAQNFFRPCTAAWQEMRLVD